MYSLQLFGGCDQSEQTKFLLSDFFDLCIVFLLVIFENMPFLQYSSDYFSKSLWIIISVLGKSMLHMKFDFMWNLASRGFVVILRTKGQIDTQTSPILAACQRLLLPGNVHCSLYPHKHSFWGVFCFQSFSHYVNISRIFLINFCPICPNLAWYATWPCLKKNFFDPLGTPSTPKSDPWGMT